MNIPTTLIIEAIAGLKSFGGAATSVTVAKLEMAINNNPEYENAKDIPLMFQSYGAASAGKSEAVGDMLSLCRNLQEQNAKLIKTLVTRTALIAELHNALIDRDRVIDALRPKRNEYVSGEDYECAAERWNALLEENGIDIP